MGRKAVAPQGPNKSTHALQCTGRALLMLYLVALVHSLNSSEDTSDQMTTDSLLGAYIKQSSYALLNGSDEPA